MAVTIVGAAIAHLGVNTREWTNGLTKAQKQGQSFFAGMQVGAFRLGAAWTATFGAMAALTLKIGGSFEREFTGVRKTVEGSEKQFGKLKNQLLEISKVTTFTGDELAVLARKGGQLGIATENLADFTKVIAKLGLAAAELGAEEAATGLARLMAITGTSQSKVGELASVLARLGDSFATNESRILNFSQRIAGLAKVAGITANDTLAMGAAFTATVPGVELVATQLSKGMAMFANAVESGGDKLKTLDSLVEHTGASFTALFRTDSATAIAEFLKGLDNVRTSGGNAFATLRELGLTNQRAAQAFLAAAGASDQFKKSLSIMRDEVEKADTAQGKLNVSFAEQMKTYEAQMDKVRNIMSVGFIKMFDAFKPAIMDVVGVLETLARGFESFAEYMQAVPTPVKTLIVVLGLAAGATIALSLVLGAIGSTLLGLKASIATAVVMWKGYTAAKVAATVVETGWVTSARSGAMVFDAQAVASAKFAASQKVATVATLGLGSALKTAAIGFIKLTAILAAAYSAFFLFKEVMGIFLDKIRGTEPAVDKLAQKMATISGNDARMAIAKQTGEWDRLTKQLAELRKETTQLGATFPKISEGMRRNRGFEALREELQGSSEGTLAMINVFKDLGFTVEETRKRLIGKEFKKLEVDELAAADAADKLKQRLEEIADFWEGARISGVPMQQEILLASAVEDWLTNGLNTGINAAAGNIGPVLERVMEALPLTEGVFGPAGKSIAGELLGADPTNVLGQAGGPMGTREGLDQGDEDPATKFKNEWIKSIRDVQRAFKAFGFDASGIIGTIIQGAVGMAAVFQSDVFKGGGTIGQGDIAGSVSAGATGIAGVLGATGSGSRGKRVAGGAMQGAAAGGQLGGPIGAAIGAAAGALVGMFRGGKVLKAMKDLAKQFGHEVSEELAKSIVESSKKFGSMENAISANLGDIIAETGVDSKNVKEFQGSFGNLIGMVENGTISMAEASDSLSTGFTEITNQLKTMGQEGSLAIGQMVTQMVGANVVTEELRAHLEGMLSQLRESLMPAIEWMSSLKNMTVEQAEALQGVLLGAWAAAVAETGSFIEAVKLLGEEFGAALTRITEALGPEGENLVAPIQQIYNTISNNQEAFDALHGIVGGLDAMAQMGVLNAESLELMGEAARVTFQEILKDTGDLNATLRSSWPELVKMYNWYEKLGMDVPAWLQENIDAGKEMGLSLEVPLSTQDAMNEMVRLLGLIAEALGAVAKEATAAGTALDKIGGSNVKGPPGAGKGDVGAQTGFHGDVNWPTTFNVGEAGPERVDISPTGGGQSGGGGMGNVVLMIDGVKLGEIITEGSKTGKVRIHQTAVDEF